MSFNELGEVLPAKAHGASKSETWQLMKSEDLPAACSSQSLQPDGSQEATPRSGSTWVIANSGAACTIRSEALVLSGAKNRKVAKLQTSSAAGVQVLPRGGYARFEVTTDGPCAPTKQAAAARKTQQLRVLAASSSRVLGTVTAMSPACEGEAVRLTVLPTTEAVRTPHAPVSLTARLMTATLQQATGRVTGTLFVINTTGKVFHTDTCPTVTATVATAKVQATTRSALMCKDGFTVAAHSSAAIAVAVPVELSKQDFLLADVGAYLSLGVGDDASRSRSDA